ncbi:PREDICTED: MLP-like protein 34 [Nelumbo nucifera]|uniref:MLP-like protein 34 n=1 Tax=Nelumbo nucifera TaxID=4432 RepID=A0A1U8QAR4_NELNU|nr:PREDICTED: MLP-like protein 34 [Nelumbo nucifera]
MALTGKLEFGKEIKSSPKKFFHCIFGLILVSSLIVDGNTVLSLDAKIEVLDEEKNLITFRCYDGDFLKHYKDCKFHIQVITEDHKNLVRYSMEYEKIDERVPEPTDYMEFGLKMLEGIDVLA